MTQVKCKIKKGDTVVVTTGRNKGATGEVLSVNPTESKVVVKGVNVVKKHVKPTQMSAGGIESRELPMHISNVALADPKDGKPTRVGYRFEKDGTKVRVARRSGEVVTQGASAAAKKPAAKAKKTKD